MNTQQIEKIINRLTADKNGHIIGKRKAIESIMQLHLNGVESEKQECRCVNAVTGREYKYPTA